MFRKMHRNEEGRGAVHGTCRVAEPGGGSSGPLSVKVSVLRRRGCWGWLFAAKRKVAEFSFRDRPPNNETI